MVFYNNNRNVTKTEMIMMKEMKQNMRLKALVGWRRGGGFITTKDVRKVLLKLTTL